MDGIVMCGKVLYPTRKEAKDAIDGQNKDRGHRSPKQPKYVYFCKGCDAWHVASAKKKRAGKRKTEEIQSKVQENSRAAGRNKILHIKDYTFKSWRKY